MSHGHTEQRYRVEIVVRSDDEVVVGTDLRKADACLHEPILQAIGAHLHFEVHPMRKASRQKDLDPRYPELTLLIRRARRNWTAYGDELVEQIRRLLRDGALLPMTQANHDALEELFRNHAVRVQLSFAGVASDQARSRRLAKQGLITPARAHVPVAYRLGRGLRMLEAHRVRKAPVSLDKAIQSALKVRLTAEDKRALQYAQRRAAMYVRKPVDKARSETERYLSEQELGAFRATIGKAVSERKGSRDLAADLREAITGSTATNDMDRIARTELAWSHSFGAYGALKAQAGEAGIDDPLVFKFVSPHACDDCKRIWGDPGDPHRYRLSFVERREAAGGNFGLPRNQWGPVVGPVHPNCTEGPLAFYDESIVDAINEVANELDDIFGGSR